MDIPMLENVENRLVAFARRLIQAPSLPGMERDAAELVRREMESLGYDRVWIDEVGNVLGLIPGCGGPSILFNGHLDHVDAGDPDLWPYPPFGGVVADGQLWGRASVDMKGALAAMVHAGGHLKVLGICPPGDVIVAGVVQEEVGGLGSRHLAETLPVARAVIGEASGNHLRRGHRGRIELSVQLAGRSVHASMPELGVNPHFSLARFLQALRNLPAAADPVYGDSTVAPTLVSSTPASANVTPAGIHLVLDWRNIPGERTQAVVAQIEDLLARSLEEGCRGRVELASKELVSYTGAVLRYPDEFPSFTTEPDDPFLVQAQACLAEVLNRPVEVGIWRFATDGGHLAAAGASVIGFGPGDDTLVHTVREHLPLDQLHESVAGYLALAQMG
ncbi:MAG TPA: M20/M25/M40 family metallo-hydrolase [Anaerolineae bacterium]|nr:M20/M25/M40 family metallo-hydrolase [Anaerolineae bacterium]